MGCLGARGVAPRVPDMEDVMEAGIVGLNAPPPENVRWTDENGDARGPLSLADFVAAPDGC